MKNQYSLLLLVIVLLSQPLLAQKRYDREYFAAFPTPYEAAASYFYTHPDAFPYTFLEKRFDGWYAKEQKFVGDSKLEEVKITKIWDAIQRKYEEGMQPDYPEDLPSNVLPKVRRADEYNAYIFPLYGYESAEKETIEILETMAVEDLNAMELEALSRAYAESIKKELTHPVIYEYFILPYDTTYQKADLSKGTMQKCKKLAQKGMEYAELLAEKYPDYEVIVGDISIKMANDYMEYYRIFNELQYTNWAKQFLKKASYPPFAIEMAKNYLRSCPDDAILITYGDNDTYTLLYVQERLQFRRDVKVLNASLMGLGRYIYNNTNHSSAMQPNITLAMRHYMVNRNNIVFFKGDKSNNVQSVLEQINQDEAISYEDKGPPWFYFPNQVTIYSGTDSIQIKHPGRYWTKDELFLLDLIVSNWSLRPICFVPFQKQGLHKALMPYLEQQGFVAQLTSELHRNFPINQSFCAINIKETEEWLLETATFEHLTDKDLENSSYIPFLYTCMSLYYELVNGYEEKGDHENAIKLLEKLRQVFSANGFNYGSYHLRFAAIYISLNLEEKAKMHCVAYLQELKEKYQQSQLPLAQKSAYQRWSKLPKTDLIRYEIQFLQKFVKEQKWPKLLEAIENWKE